MVLKSKLQDDMIQSWMKKQAMYVFYGKKFIQLIKILKLRAPISSNDLW